MALVAALALPALAAEPTELLGFGAGAAQNELALEQDLRAGIDAEEQAEWSRRLSERPHHSGSEHGAANARYLAELFEGWGYQVETESFDILLPYPDVRRVELVAPKRFEASLREEPVAGDPSSAEVDEVLAPYNAFSADGEVEGELVFVNYGIPEDYELLERYGIDVTGKIVIARYGKSWRGIKPKLAAEKGAVGTLIYSDPADDGYARGDVYPEGPFKPASGVQRGSVMDMPLYPGDVLTPGKPALRGARRLDREQAPTITRIPVLPISYQDALPLLQALDGAVVPAEWRGALPITYHIGPGPARVRLAVRSDWRRVEARDVIARLPGSELPDQWVVRGNHHDAWNHGAQDPVSGLVAMLSEAKALATLARNGHPPRRTVIYAAWDAEEPGLIGSTEWVEAHARELERNAVIYLNSDSNARGFLEIGGSHTLEPFFNQVAAAVLDPQTEVPVTQRVRAYLEVNGDEAARKELEQRDDLRLAPLGSGSDYTPFLQHLGIASGNFGFGGEGENGIYHTLYDTYAHYTRYVDPGFRYGAALAEVAGRATLRLANAEVLPFRFSGLADNLAKYAEEVVILAQQARADAERRQKLLETDAFALALDPQDGLGPPPLLPEVPFFNFAPLENALAQVTERAHRVDAALSGEGVAASAELDRLLYRSERALTDPEGLPGRSWYRHQIYAPGFYTGYGVKTLPRIREAIEARQYADVDGQIAATARTLEAFADWLSDIETRLQTAAP